MSEEAKIAHVEEVLQTDPEGDDSDIVCVICLSGEVSDGNDILLCEGDHSSTIGYHPQCCHLLHKCQIIPGCVLIVLHRDQMVIPDLRMVITCLPPKIVLSAPMLPLLPFHIARQARIVTTHVLILMHRSPLMRLP